MGKSKNYWTKERVIVEAKKHKTKWEWRLYSSGSITKAYDLGIIDDKEIVNHFNSSDPRRIEKRRKDGVYLMHRVGREMLRKFQAENEAKFCSQCNSMLPWTEFAPHPKGTYGLRCNCRDCGTVRQRERNQRSDVKEKRKEYNRLARLK